MEQDDGGAEFKEMCSCKCRQATKCPNLDHMATGCCNGRNFRDWL